MSNTIYRLYLKSHNVTGLKYLGMTRQDPHKYQGSGNRWLNHLSKHGNDVHTEILFETLDKKLIAEEGKKYSKLWNIVESNEFANLKIEEGDGGFDHINNNEQQNKKRLLGLRKAAKEGKCGGTTRWSEESYRKVRNAGGFKKGSKHKEDTKKKLSELHKRRINLGLSEVPTKTHRWYRNVETGERKMFIKNSHVPKEWVTCDEYREMNHKTDKRWYHDSNRNYLILKDDPRIKELGLKRGRYKF